MSVPTNLIPTKITGLPEYTGSSTLGYMPYILDGQTFKVQFANIAAVGAVPSTRVIASGTGLAGGGDLSANRVISIAAGGVGVNQLSLTGVTAGTYGSGSDVPVLTVDATGRVTSASTLPLNVTGFVPTSRTITAGNGLTGGGSLASDITLSASFSATTPLALGIASPGVAITLSRGDHVHPALDLSDTNQTQGALPLGRGGTGDALSPVAGAVVYSTGTKFAVSTAGAPGQVLVSNGTAAPSWTNVGAGTVTSVAVATANGLAGTVANPTVSPVITLSTTVTGMVKGDGTTLSAATAAVDYVEPGAYTASGLTMATARLLGRTTASVGAAQELTVGTGLTLASGSLVNAAPDQVVSLTAGTAISVTGTYPSFSVANTAPDQVVSLTGAGTTIITGTYPSFTITSNDSAAGTVTSINASGGTTGMSFSGGPVTSAGTLTLNGTLAIANGGTGAIDAPTALTNLGAYPASNPSGFTSNVGTVTSVSGTGTVSGLSLSGTVTSAGSLTLGGTLAVLPSNFASQTANTVLAAPNGSAGTPTFRAIVAADVPTLNQNTTGTASNVTGIVAVLNGGTGASVAGTARTNLLAAGSGANTDITSIALTTGTVSTTPTSGTDIVNKAYADSIASGINFHQSVRLATAAALPANTYNNGASGVGATLTANANGALSVDGVAAVVGNRILVKDEVTQANNGVYTVTQVGSGAAVYILTRATDFDSSGAGVDQIDAGDFFLVTAGSTQSNTSWVQQTPLPIVVGTTAIVFTQFAAPVLYSAGTGLTLAGTVFSITNTGVSASTYGSASSVPVIAINAQGQVTSASNSSISIAGSQITSGTVAITNGGTGATSAPTALTNLGAYPAANPSGFTSNTGTVTSVNLTAGTGVSVSGGPITASGSITVTNTAPDQVVALTGSGATTVTGTYPNFTISSPSGGTGSVTSIDVSGGTTGLTTSGGPVTTSGTITLAGTLGVANGGTGATTAGGALTSLGAYPAANPSGFTSNTGTVTSVNLTAGTGVSVSGGPVTTSGAITVTNTAPDQTVALTGAGTTVVTGTYPNFTITSTDSAAGTVTSVGGTGTVNGITLTGTVTTSGSLTLGGTLSGVSLTTQVSGTLPIANGGTNGTSVPAAGAVPYGTGTAYAFTAAGTSGQVLTSAGAGIPTWTTPTTGTVTSVTGTSPVVSSGGATPAISMAAATTSVNGYLTSTDWTTFNNKGSGTVTSVSGTGTVSGLTLTGTVTTSGNLTLGGTLAVTASNFASQTANTFLAAPNGSAGVPTFRAVVAADIPTLNQNTTGTATNLSTDRTNWSTNGTITAVVGQLAWKNYGNNHTIFDASNSTSPAGGAVSNTNADIAWSGTYPTLMGWNGVNTYGVRVDSARVADSAGAVDFNSLTNKTGGTGTYTTSGDFRAPIFYDSNNTAYYVDPESGSVLGGQVSFAGGSTVASNGDVYARRSSGATGVYYFADGGSKYLYWDGSSYIFGGAGPVTTTTSFRAPIFYDSDNTGFYGDFQSLSNFNRANFTQQTDDATSSIYLGGQSVVTTGSLWINFHTDGDLNYRMGKPAGAWTQPFELRFYTGQRFKASNAYGGFQFINLDTNGVLFDIGNGSAITRSNVNFYAPIMYDLDNTAYYGDFAGTSNLLGLTVANTITGSVSGNAATVGGFTPSATAGVANRVVVAHAAGYIFNNYFNSTDNSVASGVTAVMVKAGDDYYRSGTAAAVATFISGQSMNISGSSTTAGNVTGTVAVANGGTGATTLTANNVLLGNGTSAVQAVAPSTSGNLLTSNGTTWVSSAPAASYELIATVTASGASTVDFTGLSSGYVAYQLFVSGLYASAGTTTLTLRTSSNNGASYDSGASDYARNYVLSNSAGTISGAAAQGTGITLGIMGTSTYGQSLSLTLVNSGVSRPAGVDWTLGTFISTASQYRGVGFRDSTTAINAFRISCSGASTLTGTFKLYGIKV